MTPLFVQTTVGSRDQGLQSVWYVIAVCVFWAIVFWLFGRNGGDDDDSQKPGARKPPPRIQIPPPKRRPKP